MPRLSAAATHLRASVFAALRGRIEAHRAAGGELVPLHIGDTWLTPPDEALQALAEHNHRDISLYGSPAGLGELCDALAQLSHARGVTLAQSRDNVHVGCGCTHALFCAARTVLDPGDSVLLLTPYWPLVVGVMQNCEVDTIEVPLSQGLYAERGGITVALEAARNARTRAVYFVTPNNPDGYMFSREQLAEIAAFAQAHDLWVLSDEVYADYGYERPHVSIASLPDMAERTISSYSLSKSHGLAGVRIGYVVANAEVIAATRRIANHTVYNVPVPMQKSALAAVQHGAAWQAAAKRSYREARDAACAALAELGVAHHVPHGGSFVFCDLRPQLDGRPMQRLLELAIDHGVLLAPGKAFGAPFAGHLRLCFTGAPVDAVLTGIERFGQALQAL